MNVDVAIIHGPGGPFAVMKLDGNTAISVEQRNAIRSCFQQKHGPLPVVFLSSDKPNYDLISDEHVEQDVLECLRSTKLVDHRWDALQIPS